MRYLPGTFQVLFRYFSGTYLSWLNSLSPTDMTNQENQLNQLIQRIMMIQQVENWSWFFCKVPQVYWVLFRYLPELTGPKLSCNRSRRHDEPAEPIESTHTLQIVLQNSAQSWEKSDILQLKKSTLINSRYMWKRTSLHESYLIVEAYSFEFVCLPQRFLLLNCISWCLCEKKLWHVTVLIGNS